MKTPAQIIKVSGEIQLNENEDTREHRNSEWDTGYIFPFTKKDKKEGEGFFRRIKKGQAFQLYTQNSGGVVYVGDFKITSKKNLK